MARKSGWQNFADNFNSVYGTFNKVGQNIESKRIMDDEKFTAEGAKGHGLSGNDLEKARYKALGDIYTKYGNADKGLAVRQQLSNLESSERTNELNSRILENQVAIQGKLAEAQAGANVDNTRARTGKIGAETSGLLINNKMSKLGYDMALATKDSEVEKILLANQAEAGASANTIALQDMNLELRLETLNAQTAQAKTDGDRAKLAGLETSAFLGYAQDYQNGKFGTEEEAKNAFVSTVEAFDPIRAAKLSNEYSAEEVSAIANDGLKIQGEIGSFLQNQDFNGLRKYFDDKNGSMYGVKLEVNDETGAVKMYEYDRGNNQTRVFVDSPDMATALEELQALSTFGNAGLYAETLAARKKADLADEKTEAEIASLEAGTTGTERRTDLIGAQILALTETNNLTEAQTNLANQRANEILDRLDSTKGLSKRSREETILKEVAKFATQMSLDNIEGEELDRRVSEFIRTLGGVDDDSWSVEPE